MGSAQMKDDSWKMRHINSSNSSKVKPKYCFISRKDFQWVSRGHKRAWTICLPKYIDFWPRLCRHIVTLLVDLTIKP